MAGPRCEPMNLGRWRHVSASVIGTSHQKTGGVCQDSNACRVFPDSPDGDVLLAVVADGAGSAKQAGAGSAMACQSIVESASQFLARRRLDRITRKAVENWIRAFQQEISIAASAQSLRPRDYACTLLAALIGHQHAVFFQIGDGSIVVSDVEEHSYGHVFWPERGEYENATFFATDRKFAANLRFESVRRKVVELAMFSDGLQRLALDFQKSMPHEPFFRGIFPPVRKASPENAGRLAEGLSNFLGSPRVNQRTDDDKTLILATRLEEVKAEPECAHAK
jgi:Protein phosphatase 2C